MKSKKDNLRSREKNGVKAIFEETMTKNFLKLKTAFHIPEVPHTCNRITRENYSIYAIIKRWILKKNVKA